VQKTRLSRGEVQTLAQKRRERLRFLRRVKIAHQHGCTLQLDLPVVVGHVNWDRGNLVFRHRVPGWCRTAARPRHIGDLITNQEHLLKAEVAEIMAEIQN
jgi:hypothetical protein